MKTKYEVRVGSFNYYVQYFWINFVIGSKIINHYKVNFFSQLLFTIGTILVLLFFGKIFLENFGSLIGWEFDDYFIFVIMTTMLHQISGLFWFSKQLKYQIYGLRKFNFYLYIPGNRFLVYCFYEPRNYWCFIILQIFILCIYSIYFESFSSSLLILFIFISFLLVLSYITIFYFLDSFSWYFVELGKTLSSEVFEPIESMGSRRVPGDFLQFSSVKYLFMFTPAYFIATLLIPLANGVIPPYFFEYLLVICGIVIVSIIGIVINWNYGIKRYEAFG